MFFHLLIKGYFGSSFWIVSLKQQLIFRMFAVWEAAFRIGVFIFSKKLKAIQNSPA